MANRINNKRYNKLLSYRNNYFLNGSQIQRDPYNLYGRYSTPAFIEGMGGAENPNQGYEAAIETQPIDNNKSWLGNLGKSLKEGFQSGAFNGVAGALGTMTGSAISGGLSSTAGNTLSSLSGLASAIPGPWGAVASAGLGVVGGLTNRAFGTKFNKENIANVEGNINRLNNFQSNANSFDTLADTWGSTALGTDFSNSYIGKDGWFSTKAKRKANNLRKQLNEANLFALDTLQNNANNITETTMNNLEANYAALGGFLNQYSDGGSIYIKPENRGKFNATKKRTGKTTEELTHSKNPLTRKRAIFAQNAAKWKHAFGGDLNTNGADFSTGLTFIGNGGTHEENPYEGVPMGVAPDGKPNLVEEGEAIYNDYVFSNRLTVPKAVRNKYKLRGTKDLTFADAVKQLTKSATERPNDPISRETLHEIMSDLAQSQEGVREAKESKVQYANGGKLEHSHAYGDWLINDDFFKNRDFTASNLDVNIPYSRNWNKNLGEGVSQKDFDDFTNYALTLKDDNPYWTGLSAATGKDVNYLKTNYRALRSDGKYGYVSLTPKRDLQQPNTTSTSPINNSPTQPVDNIVPNIDLGRSNESLRYIPAIGLGLASLTDALGATNRPDYTEAAQIDAATRGGSYMPVSWSPVGNKLTYTPFDRDYYTNKLNAEAGATRRALANQSGGNSGRAIAGILAADYNTQDKLGDLFRKSEEYNLEQRQKVEDFNRATNQINSQGMLQADMANQQAAANARNYNLRGVLASAEMRNKARLASEAARSANLSGFLQSLGDIGYENKAMNMIRRLAEAGIVPLSEPMQNIYATPSARRKLTSNKKKK